MEPERTRSRPTEISSLIAISVGNTRVQIGLIRADECHEPATFKTDETDALAQRIDAMLGDSSDETTVVMSSVNPAAADAIEDAVGSRTGREVLRIGRDIPIRIHHTLTESGESTVGQDRLMAALGAFVQMEQACVVVDLGTAITIDFVDGTGVFHGGAILPGIAMMLDALHKGTAALPELAFERLSDTLEPGKQTDAAMRLGVVAAARGAIRMLAERYAEFYGAYPVVVATGGDLGVLEDDELVEARLPDLVLRGIHAACAKALDDDASDHDPDDDPGRDHLDGLPGGDDD